MRKYFYLFTCSITLFTSNAQNIDSLWNNIALAQSNDSLLVERYLDLGFTYHYNTVGNDSQALEVAQKALNLSEKNEQFIQAAVSSELIAQIQGSNNQYEASMKHFDQAIDYFSREEAHFKAILVGDNKANYMLEKGYYNEALDIKLKANNYFKKQGSTIDYAISNEGIGVLYMDKGQFELARDYLLKAYRIQEQEHYENLAYSSSNLALAYQNLGKVDSAYHYFYITREKGQHLDVIHNNNEAFLSALLLDEGRIEEAESIIKALVHSFPKNSDNIDLLFYKGILAETYAVQAQFDSAFYYIRQIENSTQENRPFRRRAFLKTAYKSYEQANQPVKALQYYKQFRLVQDSINNVENQATFKEIETKYAVAEKEKLILEQQLSLRNRLLYISVLAALLLLGVLLLVNRQQKNTLLQKNNELISISLKEKETLLKEIHHRVKNNLQVISSLLNLQTRTIDDPAALDAINEGRNRVKSMALIHQNLYQDETLMTVNTKNYIHQLTDNLFKAYNINPDKIKIEQQIEDLTLDVDTIIPVGLILNELISNALKHAFLKQENGIIKVTLRRKDNNVQLRVSDNGIGIAQNAYSSASSSLGSRIVQLFTNKLKGQLKIDTQNGTNVSILF